MVRLAVVTPTRNRRSDLQRYLNSLRPQRSEIDEIIIIDNGSTDGSSDVVERHAGAKLIVDPTPNLPHLFNRGWRSTDADIIGFLNDDVVVDYDWAREIRRWFATLNDAAAISGPMRDKIPRRMHSRIERGQTLLFRLYDQFLVDGRLFDYGYMTDWGTFSVGQVHPSVAKKVKGLTITNMAVRREALETIGGFREEFSYSNYDGWFFVEAMRRGLSLYAVPTAGVDHYPNPVGKTRSSAYLAHDYATWFRMFRANAGLKTRFRTRLAEIAMLTFYLAEGLDSSPELFLDALEGYLRS
jgi:GT2 family glycosyltransferase